MLIDTNKEDFLEAYIQLMEINEETFRKPIWRIVEHDEEDVAEAI